MFLPTKALVVLYLCAMVWCYFKVKEQIKNGELQKHWGFPDDDDEEEKQQ